MKVSVQEYLDLFSGQKNLSLILVLFQFKSHTFVNISRSLIPGLSPEYWKSGKCVKVSSCLSLETKETRLPVLVSVSSIC